MQRIILTAITALVMALVLGPVIIPWLKKLKLGKVMYELGPDHAAKAGTPQMGGIIFALPAIAAVLIFSRKDVDMSLLVICLASALGFGAIGFIDDFLKVKKHSSEGLTPKQKLAPQILLSIALSVWAYLHPEIGASLTVPFVNAEWNLGWFYIPVMVFILVGTVNSANLLDGLDGLLGGCSLFDFVTMTLICLTFSGDTYANVAIFGSAIAGGLIGYLQYNSHPAQVFMGDVGSFFIGGALVGMTLVTRLSLLLPLIALTMFLSSVSDLIQFGYFRATHGKRFFRMAPLHHHFEKGGMPETRIVAMYYIVTVALCLVAMLGFV